MCFRDLLATNRNLSVLGERMFGPVLEFIIQTIRGRSYVTNKKDKH